MMPVPGARSKPLRYSPRVSAQARPETEERRPVGLFSLLALGVNGIVGVGIFFVPADLAGRAPGLGSVLVFAVTALALAPVAATFATLGKRFHEDGGPVVYARAAFGEFAAFLVGWVTYVSAITSAAAIMVALTAAVVPDLGPWGTRIGATTLLTLLAGIVAAGIVISARTWTTLTVLKLLPLVALVGALFLAGAPGATSLAAPVLGASWLAAGLPAMFALQGFEVVPVIAGQVRAPARAIPLATFGSLAASALLYMALQLACVLALPDLASSRAPLAEAAGVLGGPVLSRMVALGTSVSALGIATGMVVVTPRYLSALAQNTGLGFGLAQMSARGVPLRALGVTWVLVAVLIQSGSRGQLFALSSVSVLMQYLVTAAALVVLGRRRERGLTPRHAWLSAPAVAVALVLGAGASPREALVAAAAVLLGLGLRLASSRRKRIDADARARE
jgi:basic amino acid/polyamine antiporter, APA family